MEDAKEEKKPEEKEEGQHTKGFSDLLEEYKKENEKKENLLKREEELAARNLLAGKSDAGVQPTEPVEETPKEYADRIMKGG
jgi:hypothetical protein